MSKNMSISNMSKNMSKNMSIACQFQKTSSSKSQGGQFLEIEYRCNGNRVKFHPFIGNSRTG
jgi:hypothetical protein